MAFWTFVSWELKINSSCSFRTLKISQSEINPNQECQFSFSVGRRERVRDSTGQVWASPGSLPWCKPDQVWIQIRGTLIAGLTLHWTHETRVWHVQGTRHLSRGVNMFWLLILTARVIRPSVVHLCQPGNYHIWAKSYILRIKATAFSLCCW